MNLIKNGISIVDVFRKFHPMQHEAEFLWMWDRLPELENVLEIGMGCGATAALFSFSGAQVTTIDPRENVIEEDTPTWMDYKFKAMVPWAKPVKWIRKFSTDPTVMSDLIIPAGGKWDLLHIDGDHSYEGAHYDWNTFAPMAKLIAVHDIYGWDRPDVHFPDGPRGLWNELHGDSKFHPLERCIGDDSSDRQWMNGGMGLVEYVA